MTAIALPQRPTTRPSKWVGLAVVGALIWMAAGFGARMSFSTAGRMRHSTSIEQSAPQGSSTCPDDGTSDDIYVRDGGTGNGSAWNNALDDIPATIPRGDEVLIADGNYGGENFNDAVSGTTVSSICKATEAYHGTSTGWLSSYGDGVAHFTDTLSFSTSYWKLDGATGGGPDSWRSGFGFTQELNDTNGIECLSPATNITVRHIEIIGSGTDNSEEAISLRFNRCNNFTISYYAVDLIGFIPFYLSEGATDFIAEYGFIGEFHYGQTSHAETASIWGGIGPHPGEGPKNVTFRWNLITSMQSTGGLMFDSLNTPGTPKVTCFYYGNVFRRISGTLDWVGGNGMVGGWDSNSAELENCKFYNNTMIDFPATHSGGEILEAIGGEGVQTNNEVKNNLFLNIPHTGGGWQVNDSNHFINTTAFGSNSSTSVGDPMVDYPNNNFRMTTSTTPGIDLGPPYNVDMYGKTRTTWTRGCCEPQ